jgi:methanogenic corrinoid protein MtbC1
MDPQGTLAARFVDSALRSLAAQTVVRQRQLLLSRGEAAPASAFEDMLGDAQARLLVLCEAMATARPALFLEQVEWSRSAYDGRGVPDGRLALHISCLREVLLAELPALAHEPVLAVLEPALRLFDHPVKNVESMLDDGSPHIDRIRRLLLLVLEGRRDDALRSVLGACDEGLSVSEIETQILAPLQAEIGLFWQRGDLHVHEEHLGSQVVQEALVLLRSRLTRGAPTGRSVLIGSSAGNLHDIGARIVADHFEMDGWRTLHLGANVPGEDLARAVIDFRADLVALSVTLTSQVRSTAATIEYLRACCAPEPPPILVGGPPFNAVNDLWQVVGADGWAPNAGGAVREGRRLLALG